MKEPFNDELKKKLAMQQAILAASEEILRERKQEVLDRAKSLLEISEKMRNARG